MEQGESQKKSSVRLDVLDWGTQTVFWDEIEKCVRESMDADEITVANALSAVRKRELYAIGIFTDGVMSAVTLVRVVDLGYSGKRGLLVYGLTGDLDLGGWEQACVQLEGVARAMCCSRIIAGTVKEHVRRLAEGLGWTATTQLTKEV